MNVWKKIAGVFITGVLVFSLSACGNTSSSGNQSDGNQADTAQNETDSTAENDKTLIAYFSYTGNTEEVAGLIADYTGGILVQIERAEPYDDVNAQGEEELNTNARPEITVNLDSIENYDHIFIGYPNVEQDFACV